MAEFKTGEMVRLHGKWVVVAFIPGDGSVLDWLYRKQSKKGEIGCRWFDTNREIKTGFFSAASLEKTPSADIPRHSFGIGDKVKLKSGGPAMTIIFRAGDGSVWDRKYRQHCDRGDLGCRWFDERHQDKLGFFNPALLEPASGP